MKYFGDLFFHLLVVPIGESPSKANGAGGTPAAPSLLTEAGDHLLLETGDKILTE